VRIFTNLNLNGTTPARVQPKVGEWGPTKVPTTAAKKRMRIWVSIAFVVVLAVLVFVGWTFFKALTQSA
jgi:type VI protein secretion system component VasF